METFRIANAEWFGCPLDTTEKYLKSAVPEARLSCDVLLNFGDRNEQCEIYAMSAVFMRRSPILCGKIINARRKFRHESGNLKSGNLEIRQNCHYTVLNVSVNDANFDMTKLREGLAMVMYSLHGGKLTVTDRNFQDIYLVSVLIGCSEITDVLSEISVEFGFDFEKVATKSEEILKKIVIQDGENYFDFDPIVNLTDSGYSAKKSPKKSKTSEIPGPNFPIHPIVPISKMSESEKANLTSRLIKEAESTRKQNLEKLGWTTSIGQTENSKTGHSQETAQEAAQETAQELVNTMTESNQERTNFQKKTEMIINIERARQQSIHQSEQIDKLAEKKRRLNQQLKLNERKRKNDNGGVKIKTNKTMKIGSCFEDLVLLESGNLNKAVGSMLVGPSFSHKNEKYFKKDKVDDEVDQVNTWRENTGYNMPKPNMPPSGFNLPKPNIPMRMKDSDDGVVMIHANIPPAMPKPSFETNVQKGLSQNQFIQQSLPPPNMPKNLMYQNSHPDNTRNDTVNSRLKLW